jgi:nitroreductase
METLEAIKTRRSIRKYKTTPVDDKTLALVLEAAQLAPSWDNSQCWRFIVVKDAQMRNELANTMPKSNPALNAVKQAPITLVACAQLGKAGYLDGKLESDKGDWYMFDLALAMQNLVLAAHSLGLGTVYIGWFDAKKVAQMLEVPESCPVVAMTPLGYPDHQPRAHSRKEIPQIVSYEKFSFK